MSRNRLTRRGLFGRTAAPDETSGMNPNVPINLYDTKPNARFPVGSEVVPIDSQFVMLKGIVLGHIAEDRLLVQLPRSIEQFDVEEVVSLSEVEVGKDQVSSAVASRTGPRRSSSLITFDDLRKFSQDARDEEDLEYIPDRPNFLDGDPVDDSVDVHRGELPSEQDPRETIDEDDDQGGGQCGEFDIVIMTPEVGDMTDIIEEGLRTGSREGAWSDFFNRKKKQEEPEWSSDSPVLQNLRKQGYTSEGQAVLWYNLFRDAGVREEMVNKYGFAANEVDMFTGLRDHQLEQMRKKFNAGKLGKLEDLKWGQGTGIALNYTGPKQPGQQQSQQSGQQQSGQLGSLPIQPPTQQPPTQQPASPQWPALPSQEDTELALVYGEATGFELYPSHAKKMKKILRSGLSQEDMKKEIETNILDGSLTGKEYKSLLKADARMKRTEDQKAQETAGS